MKFLKALSIFLGTVIGVGIFGLPFVALRAGFFVIVFYFIFMALAAILIHLLYGEVVLGSEKIHRLPGYVEKYLGVKWKKVTFLVVSIGLTGALLAYLIVGGEFLNFFLGPYLGGNSTLYSLLFFTLGAYLVFRGIKTISGVELSLLFVLFVIFIIFFVKAVPVINIDYLRNIDLKFLTFPFGVVLFSLWGSGVVPEIKEMFIGFSKQEVRANLKKVISWGIIIAAIIYLVFVFMVLGTSGPATSKEAISGLEQALGSNVIKLGFIFGVISCFTSFITLALTLKKVLWYDFGLSKNFAWFLTLFLPLTLFLLGLREFIEIIGFTGAVAIGIEGIIIVILYRRFLEKKFARKMNPLFYLLAGIFVLGIVFEMFHFSTF